MVYGIVYVAQVWLAARFIDNRLKPGLRDVRLCGVGIAFFCRMFPACYTVNFTHMGVLSRPPLQLLFY